MHRHRLSYREVREIMEMPQDILDFRAAIAQVAEQRQAGLGS